MAQPASGRCGGRQRLVRLGSRRGRVRTIDIVDIPADVASIVIEVASEWRDEGDYAPHASGSRTRTVERPAATTCPSPSPTPSPSTVVSSTTSGTPSTTPSVPSTATVTATPSTPTEPPCEGYPGDPQDPPTNPYPTDPSSPPDPECLPPVTVDAVRHEIDGNAEPVVFHYVVVNESDEPVTVLVNGIETVLEPGPNPIVSTSLDLTVTWNGEVVALADSNPETCMREVEVSKEVLGVQPDDTRFTIRISRIVVDADGDGEDDSHHEPVAEFELMPGGSEVLSLPVGPSYLIEELAEEGEFRPTITIDGRSTDRLVIDEFRGERISVVVTNHYASVEIDKKASSDLVEVGMALSYDLTVTNSGALALSPVAVDDLLPPGVGFVDWSWAGETEDLTCEATEGPQDYVLCVHTGILGPGEELPTITIDAVIEDGAAGTQIVNESRVRGQYVDPAPAPTTAPAALRAARAFGPMLRFSGGAGADGAGVHPGRR